MQQPLWWWFVLSVTRFVLCQKGVGQLMSFVFHHSGAEQFTPPSCKTSGNYLARSLAVIFVGKCETFVLHVCSFTTRPDFTVRAPCLHLLALLETRKWVWWCNAAVIGETHGKLLWFVIRHNWKVAQNSQGWIWVNSCNRNILEGLFSGNY